MSAPEGLAGRLLAPVASAPRKGRRRLVAVAGPPGSGKSTLAEALAQALSKAGIAASVVPMDGFHLDNAILDARGLLARKGAPETFDVRGLMRLIPALADEEEVFYPVFDRARDLAIAGAGCVGPGCDTVILEGNYLLLAAEPWAGLERSWDLSVALSVPEDELERRLIARWRAHGHDPEAARARAEANDLPNARLVARASLPADITLP